MAHAVIVIRQGDHGTRSGSLELIWRAYEKLAGQQGWQAYIRA